MEEIKAVVKEKHEFKYRDQTLKVALFEVSESYVSFSRIENKDFIIEYCSSKTKKNGFFIKFSSAITKFRTQLRWKKSN